MAIFLDAFNEIQQKRPQQYGFNQPVYLPLNTGLGKLLDHYGIKEKKSYVMDENCYVNRDQTSGEMPIYFAPVIKNENINHSLDFIENIKQLIVLKVSPLEIIEEKAHHSSRYKSRIESLCTEGGEKHTNKNRESYRQKWKDLKHKIFLS